MDSSNYIVRPNPFFNFNIEEICILCGVTLRNCESKFVNDVVPELQADPPISLFEAVKRLSNCPTMRAHNQWKMCHDCSQGIIFANAVQTRFAKSIKNMQEFINLQDKTVAFDIRQEALFVDGAHCIDLTEATNIKREALNLVEDGAHFIDSTEVIIMKKETMKQEVLVEKASLQAIKSESKGRRRKYKRLAVVREESDDLYECPECEKEFTSSSAVLQHLKTHINDPIFICKHCKMKFRTLRTKINHDNLQHRDISNCEVHFLRADEFLPTNRQRWRK